ncbi:hypothetical protein ACFQH6_19510 [Halobacteriaceae archaeon GCM10025711]
MSVSAARGFNLYNFFSVLLPGVAFIIGLIPLLPSGTSVDPVVAIIPLLAGGFVIGQGLHSLAVRIQHWWINKTHREIFQEALWGRPQTDESDQAISLEEVIRDYIPVLGSGQDKTSTVEPAIIKEFYTECQDTFDHLDIEPFVNREENTEETLTGLYTMIRSYIHIDSRGRSRVFQSIYAFCRSTWIALLILWVVYSGYAWIIYAELFQKTTDSGELLYPYTTFLREMVADPAYIFIGATFLFLGGYLAFGRATEEYKRYYVQYLISDFLVLRSESAEEEADGIESAILRSLEERLFG